MRIGIDARELCGHPTGVGRYVNGLLTAWSVDPRARNHEFFLYTPEPIDLLLDGHRFFTRTVPGPGGTWWEQVRLPRAVARDHLDVFFAPAYSTALRHKVPTVVAIHDLSFVAHPEWFSPREGARRRWLVRRSAANARAIVTISQFSSREILELLHIGAERVHVIPPGVTAPPCSTAASQSRLRESRALYVGTIFNRRRLPDLIRAFAPIARARPDAALDIVGDNRTYPHQDLRRAIGLESLTSQVQWRPYVSDHELAGLYASARAFAFLSEYEGLGLTPLEALACGIPPVLLDSPVARESCGDAALYVPRGDIKATTEALEGLLFDETRRAELLAAAPAVLARYNWPRAAADTLRVLEKSALRPPA
jgi:glycosyltransferase involved in cell wall biosynthesis